MPPKTKTTKSKTTVKRSVRRSVKAAPHPMPARPRICVIIPAHNEEEEIAATLDCLLAQTRKPDLIVVSADNCEDDTVAEASAKRFRKAGVQVIETVNNTNRKPGALNQAFCRYVVNCTKKRKGRRIDANFDYVLGVDADTSLEPEAVEQLEQEMTTHPDLGGIMARYNFDPNQAEGFWQTQLLRIQRLEFAGWTFDILRRDGRTYVLGGQATLFRTEALVDAMDSKRRAGPWPMRTMVEDMELTWDLQDLGWDTRCSPDARAWAGPMLSLKSLWAQRRKWDTGIASILLDHGFQKPTWYPWRLQLKTFLDTLIRVMFFTLLFISLARGSFQWSWIWAIPPVLAIVVNLRTALVVPNRTLGDIIWAIILVPSELYLYFRIGTWAVSWWSTVLGFRRDGWSAQYRAEGKPVLKSSRINGNGNGNTHDTAANAADATMTRVTGATPKVAKLSTNKQTKKQTKTTVAA